MLLYCQKTNPRVEKKVRARDVPYITKEWKAAMRSEKRRWPQRNFKCPQLAAMLNHVETQMKVIIIIIVIVLPIVLAETP